MQSGVTSVVQRGALLAGLYLAGAVTTVFYLRTPADVALFWPSAGIALAFTVRYGLGYVAVVALATLVLHLLPIAQVPPRFLWFSVASNAIGTLMGAWYVRRLGRPLSLRINDGLRVLRGGVLLCLVSAAIGTTGMLHAGMVPKAETLRVFVQWVMGDLLGATSAAPLLLFLLQGGYRHVQATHATRVQERITWVALLVLSLLVVRSMGSHGSIYPLAIVNLPLALLLWSAARYPPLLTMLASLVVTVCLSLMLGLGLGGFPRPEGMADTTLLMTTLIVHSVIPILLLAYSHERNRATASLRQRATTDMMTGLLNRSAFEEQARQKLGENRQAMSLMYTDLDHFKVINDSASHVAGDEVIRQVASLVAGIFDSGALVARTGGDQFTVLAPLDENTMVTRARRFQTGVEALRVAWKGQNLGVTASVGVATTQPPHMTYDELLSQADSACYTAKELGGNRVLTAAANPDDLRARVRVMRSAIAAREALDQHRFTLWCQPIVDLRQPGPVQSHFEVLLRWQDPDGTLHAPAELVAAAERYHLGPKLDRYVVDAMLGWLNEHPEACQQVQMCSVNLSGDTLVEEDFSDYLANRLRRSLLPAQRLCLEITETSVVRDMTRARRFIERMKALGCKFALDDFGTGFCSFGYLRELDVDYLKIDGSFIRNLDSSRLSESVVRSISDIAHVLDKRAVAEHAENKRQLELLRKLGVDYAQGYVYQRPLPIADFFGAAPGAGTEAKAT